MDFTRLFGSMGGLCILISLCVIVPFLAIAGFFLISSGGCRSLHSREPKPRLLQPEQSW